MIRWLTRIHVAVYAYFVRYFRLRHLTQVFAQAHRDEITHTPAIHLPLTLARQANEMRAVRAGRLDVMAKADPIVDRKSWAWPFLPASVNRLSTPVIKSTPYNLRRMSRTPVPRRAMNLIKGAFITQPWDVEPVEGKVAPDGPDGQAERIKIAKAMFSHPNNQDSFQTFNEMCLEDMLVLGAYVAEMRFTLEWERPIKMWPVNVESIRIFPSWAESTPDMPHYAQMTGLKGERGAVLFYDDELLYVKDNPSTDNPFGLGKMEVGFSAVNDFLGVQGMAGRAGADQVHKTFMWWETPQNEAHYQIVRRHIQNELEGQAKLSIIGGMKKPEIVEVTPVTEEDLLLNWQELLIRMIANAFDMSAMALGVEHDINRAVGEVLDDKDFRSAVVPVAKRIEQAYTRRILHNKLGWYDLQFRFLNLDDPDTQTKVDMYGRLYSMNSITPAEIRKGLGMKPLASPFAELTQFECMLLNIEAMEQQQNNLADAQANRSLQVQQVQNKLNPPQPATPETPATMPPKGQKQLPPGSNGPQKMLPAPAQQPGGGGMGKVTPGSASRGGQPPSPKALSLPKFPIASSRYNAKQIAQMPLNQMTDTFKATGMSMIDFAQQLDSQEPGILETLSDEIKDYVKEKLDEELHKPEKKVKPQLIKQWQKELGIRFRLTNKRTSDYTSYLHDPKNGPGGQATDSAGVARPRKVGGKPGNINPVQKG